MDPEAIAVKRNGDIGRAIDHYAAIVFGVLAELADMDVGVALGALFQTVDGEAPLIAPDFAAFSDGGGPVGSALLRRHIEQLLRALAVKPGQGEPAIRLVGI